MIRNKIVNERININVDKFNELKALMNENVNGSIWPNSNKDSIDPGSDVYPLIKLCLEDSLSVSESVEDNLSLFKNKRKAVNLVDQMNIKSFWYVNNTPLSEKTPDWCTNRVNSLLTKKYTSQSSTFQAFLLFKAYDNVLFRYDGTLKIGVHYRINEHKYGITVNPSLTLTYVIEDDAQLNSKDNKETDLTKMLDFDSNIRGLNVELMKRKVNPIKSLINNVSDFAFLPSRQTNTKSFSEDKLSKICLLCSNGNAISKVDSKTSSYIQSNRLSSVVEIDGIIVYDGRRSKDVPRLIDLIYREISRIETYDSLFSMYLDFLVKVIGTEGQTLMYQTCNLKLTLSRVFINVSTEGINPVKNMDVKVNRFSDLELEYVVRDNIKRLELSSPLDKRINISKSYNNSYSLKSLSVFTNNLKSLSKTVANYILGDLDKNEYSISISLDGNSDLITDNNLVSRSYVKELFDELRSLSDDEELVMDLKVIVFYTLYNRTSEIFGYKGTFSVVNDGNMLTYNLSANSI